MIRNLGKKIQEINLLTYHSMLTGIEFTFIKETDKEYFTISNGLDQNAMDIIRIQDREGHIKRVVI